MTQVWTTTTVLGFVSSVIIIGSCVSAIDAHFNNKCYSWIPLLSGILGVSALVVCPLTPLTSTHCTTQAALAARGRSSGSARLPISNSDTNTCTTMASGRECGHDRLGAEAWL